MKKVLLNLTVLLCLFLMACANGKEANTQDQTMESPAPAEAEMMDEKLPTVVEVAMSNKDFSTLVAAVKAADLVETLNGEGPFTVFAPVNAAFAKLPEGTVESLLEMENKATLQGILTYHVVAGSFKAADVLAAIKDSDGSFAVSTVQGGTLLASLNDGKVILTDEKGNSSTVIMTDVEAANGVIHAIDSVVMPE
jgi:uncharacterized surface protein with fasciclin (FAS1) repeats